MNIESLETRLRIGYFTEILVTPAELQTGNNVRSMSFKDRKCLFSDELPSHMAIFKQYSQVEIQIVFLIFHTVWILISVCLPL